MDRGSSNKLEGAWILFSMLILAMSEGSLVVFAISVRSTQLFVYSMLVSVASLSLGGLLGFLFGIPRSLAASANGDDAGTGNGRSEDNKSFRARYAANTNLEQISDWLTKILVGVGLTQLSTLSVSMGELGRYISSGTSELLFTPPIAATVCIGFFVLGFILVYLWTRLYLGGQFAQADLKMFDRMDARIDEITKNDRETNEKLGEFEIRLKEQATRDAAALNIIERWLLPNDAGFYAEEVVSSVKKASPPVKTQIFYRAREARQKFASEKNRELLFKTVPIFEALVGSGPRDMLHQYHGQLGYIFHELPMPTDEELSRAVDELSKAIAERDDTGRHGHETYEFVRALCRIRLDSDARNELPSTREVRAKIVADLQSSLAGIPDLADDQTVIHWLEINEINDLNAIQK